MTIIIIIIISITIIIINIIIKRTFPMQAGRAERGDQVWGQDLATAQLFHTIILKRLNIGQDSISDFLTFGHAA